MPPARGDLPAHEVARPLHIGAGMPPSFFAWGPRLAALAVSTTIFLSACSDDVSGEDGGATPTSSATGDAGKADATTQATETPPRSPNGEGCVPKDPTGFKPEPYKQPRAPQGACSPAELARFEECVQQDSPGPDCDSALQVGPAGSCSACIYSRDTDTRWGPVIVDATQSAIVNLLGCIELRGEPACVETIRKSWGCLGRACAACTTDMACIEAARGGVCKKEAAAAKASCPVGGAYDACAPAGADRLAQLMIATRVFCAAGPADAGSD